MDFMDFGNGLINAERHKKGPLRAEAYCFYVEFIAPFFY